MQVYSKILVAMDCSPVDEAILKHVAALALQNQAKVWLLHVVHSHTLDQDRVLRKDAESFLAEHCQALRHQGIDAYVVIRSGEPEAEVLAEIAGKDYDLVALATHGHTFWGDLLYGSVSRKLKHKIHVPLLMVRP